MNSGLIIACPQCGRKGDWFAAPQGPFCSRRCRLVDLGKWFNEEHAVSEPLRPEHLEPDADLPARIDPDFQDDQGQAG